MNRSFDEIGRTINQYVNLNGYYNVSVWGGYNAKIPKTPLEGKLNLNADLSRTPSIINSVKAFTHNYSITLTPGLTYSKEDNFFTSFEVGGIYTQGKSTQIGARNIKFFSFNPMFSFIKYYKNFEAGTDFDYVYNPPVDPYPNPFSRFIWNAYASYKLLPNKNLELRASINDILNQNKGYERTTTNNFNTERNFLTLGRYWMVGFIYNFKHGAMADASGKPGSMKGMGGPRPPRGGGGKSRRR